MPVLLIWHLWPLRLVDNITGERHPQHTFKAIHANVEKGFRVCAEKVSTSLKLRERLARSALLASRQCLRPLSVWRNYTVDDPASRSQLRISRLARLAACRGLHSRSDILQHLGRTDPPTHAEHFCTNLCCSLDRHYRRSSSHGPARRWPYGDLGVHRSRRMEQHGPCGHDRTD